MFWVLWIFDALLACIPAYFFLVGLKDGSVSSFNISLWLAVLLVVAGVLVGGLLFRSRGHSTAALLVLAILAVPGALGALFFLWTMISNPRWN